MVKGIQTARALLCLQFQVGSELTGVWESFLYFILKFMTCYRGLSNCARLRAHLKPHARQVQCKYLSRCITSCTHCFGSPVLAVSSVLGAEQSVGVFFFLNSQSY
ncbi:hypothetical protein M758_UG323300 [Ceratodon purpureus]|nr:hypothetical protein M758_UG323300 [Ceratodon purpureus]